MHKSIPVVISFVLLVGFMICFSLLAAARGAGGPPPSSAVHSSNDQEK